MSKKEDHIVSEPYWYKDAILYELNVKSFHDSDADGIGDFGGLTEKLDYLQSLGITAIWLLPFYPSPLRDDGYDIADYFNINPQYGTLRDFKIFLKEAHKRNIYVITELVLNHTSDQHEWFRLSRKAKPDSNLRNFYSWSDTPDKYKDARIIFTDFETSNWAWDPQVKAYYWHRFYSHQPDLNYDNPSVVKAMLKVVDYWFEMGVDGMRLDAVPYLFEKEGTNCENLPETYQFIEKLRSHIDKKFKNKLLIAEANQWPEDAVAYLGEGNRCHMAFHFPVMPRLFMASWMEDRFPVIDIFEQTPNIPYSCQWAMFLRNHDELTLEMVSDEERDYMYRVYAKDPTARINLGIRRRLAPLLGNNRRKIELMNILLFSLPGTPVIYYGDEIGMGDNHYLGDRNGVRTPMQWNSDRNAGFSRVNPQKLFLPVIIDPDYHYESINVENQDRNQSSLLWWMKRVIAMRKRFKAFGRGTIEFLNSNNPKILPFVRKYEDENILVVVNLSRFSQVVELDLSQFAGYVPEEIVSSNKFPPIEAKPYTLTLAFYDYFMFTLQKEEAATPAIDTKLPEVTVSGGWDKIFSDKYRERLERSVLPQYLSRMRWFGGKARKIQRIRLLENMPMGNDPVATYFVLAEVRYTEGSNEIYLIPISFTAAAHAEKVKETPQALIANLRSGTEEGIIYDGVYNPEFRKNLIKLLVQKQNIKGVIGSVVPCPGKILKGRKLHTLPADTSYVIKAEQSNTSIIYGNELFFKIYRRLDEGINPELEIGKHLTENVSFANIPAYAGAVEYRRHGAEPMVVGIIQKFVPNEGDAWTYTIDSASGYFERVLAKRNEIKEIPRFSANLFDVPDQDVSLLMQELIGGVYLQLISKIGKRTGELHLSLASSTDDPNFRSEPFTLLYQRSLYHSMRTLCRRVFEQLKKNIKNLNESVKLEAEEILKREKEINNRFSDLFKRKISATKIRIHGDYHLGQLLYTGNDVIIIDFEGEPARTIGDRRLKRSPLRDVAGMIRSFHYPGYATLFSNRSMSPEDLSYLNQWADAWYQYVSGIFLKSYLGTVFNAPFIPADKNELDLMLNVYLLEKSIYEVGYELNNRPDWLVIPLHGIRYLLEAAVQK